MLLTLESPAKKQCAKAEQTKCTRFGNWLVGKLDVVNKHATKRRDCEPQFPGLPGEGQNISAVNVVVRAGPNL